MNELDTRVNQIERNLAVMDHRLLDLEGTPPRINTLENTVTHLQLKVEAISSDITEIKSEGKDTHRQVLNLRDDVKRLFAIGVMVVTLISAAAALVSLYDTWLAVDRRHRTSIMPLAHIRGFRNCNPGNLRLGTRWIGLAEVQSDPDFCRFVSHDFGIRAMSRTLRTYYQRHELRTIREFINRWDRDGIPGNAL